MSGAAALVLDKGVDLAGKWRDLAACRPGTGVDPRIFFPVGENISGREMSQRSRAASAKALRVCRECLVQRECLLFALSEIEDPPGVWGGTTPWQRAMIRAARRRLRAP